MTLSDYVKLRNLKPHEGARLFNVSKSGYLKWLRGERLPRPRHMKRIVEATNGAVTVADLLGARKIDEPESEAA